MHYDQFALAELRIHSGHVGSVLGMSCAVYTTLYVAIFG